MNVARVGIAGGLAVVVTLGLLYLMHSLINTDLGEPDEAREVRIPDVHMPTRDIDTRYDTPRPDRPEEPETPPPDLPEPEFDTPDINPEGLNMTAPAAGQMQLAAGVGFSGDGEFLPIVRVSPEYPSNAAARGIEGYVTVEFTVTENGSVKDVVVLEGVTKDGNPTSIFNRSAIRAAERSKYRPRVIDGVAVEVPGVRLRFNFELAQN